MDITVLHYFNMIAECGSLTKAAKQLHISQPAMSAMLKKFEEELGVELFDRTSNRIYLNQAGEVALIHVNTILSNIEQLKSDVLSVAHKSNTLSIAFCDPGVRWFTVPRFSIAFPDIQINDDLYEGKDIEKLLTERVYDIMITPYNINTTKIQSLTYLKDHVYLSVPEDGNLAKQSSISIRDIPSQPILYPQIGGYFLSQLEKLINDNNLSIQLIKNNYNVTQHLIRTTNFLATISTLSMDLRNDGTHRKLIPISDEALHAQFYVSFLKSNKEKVHAFLTWTDELHSSNSFLSM